MMVRLRAITGLIAGAIFVLSSVAHSVLGWPSVSQQLVAARVPTELLQGIKAGWQFGGVAMLVFGLIVIVHFAKRLGGQMLPRTSMAIIAVGYIGFGIWALVMSGWSPFFLIFLVPGLFLGFAAS